MNLERKVLVAFLRSWLKKKFDELGREIGQSLEGSELTTKDVKPLILDCLSEAFEQLWKEYREKWAKENAPRQ